LASGSHGRFRCEEDWASLALRMIRRDAALAPNGGWLVNPGTVKSGDFDGADACEVGKARRSTG
jgi:hypothetical protein